MNEPTVPNHHAHYPGFSGPSGLIAALSMAGGRSRPDARSVARLSGVGPGDAVVDIGCGAGTAARHAARLGASVTAVDPAPVMLRVARLLTWPSLKVRYLDGTAEALPVPDGSASVVWSIAAAHHWDDLDAGLREVCRVLRPGGRFVAIERHSEVGTQGLAAHGWTDAQAEAFANCCRGLGFADLHIVPTVDGRRSTINVIAGLPSNP